MPPVRSDPNKYDVVVVGAGVGGLVSGCTLAKAGMKVAVVEKQSQPGGCCASFKRKGFSFDTGISSIGGCGLEQRVGRILKALDLDRSIKFIQQYPKEKIIAPDFEFSVQGDENACVDELIRLFPNERNSVRAFFEFITGTELSGSFGDIKDASFETVLNKYFSDAKLKAILNLVMGNLGLPASRVSAVAGRVLMRDFVFNAGYYPKGGMGSFCRAIADKFIAFGGDLFLGEKVSRILVNQNSATGVELNSDIVLESGAVISNADARQTFLSLVGRDHLSSEFFEKLDALIPSCSAFLVFLGIDGKLDDLWGESCNLLKIFHYDVEAMFRGLGSDSFLKAEDYIYCLAPSRFDKFLAPEGCESLCLLTLAPFRNEQFWANNRELFAENIIRAAERLLPGLTSRIIVKETAAPTTFQRYTSNSSGAIYGWDSIPSQVGMSRFPQHTPIENLYLAGHWTTPGPGVGMVAYSGYNAAKKILRDARK